MFLLMFLNGFNGADPPKFSRGLYFTDKRYIKLKQYIFWIKNTMYTQ